MQIDKNMIIDLLRQKGANAQADQAQGELPDRVDTDQHADMLSKFGISPQELISKFTGGGGEGGGGIGGMVGDALKGFGK